MKTVSCGMLLGLRKETLANTLLHVLKGLPEEKQRQVYSHMKRAELLAKLEFYRDKLILTDSHVPRDERPEAKSRYKGRISQLEKQLEAL